MCVERNNENNVFVSILPIHINSVFSIIFHLEVKRPLATFHLHSMYVSGFGKSISKAACTRKGRHCVVEHVGGRENYASI